MPLNTFRTGESMQVPGQPRSGNTSSMHVTGTYITFSTNKPPNAMSTHAVIF